MKRTMKKVIATVAAFAMAFTLTAGFAPTTADAAKKKATVKSVTVKSPKSKKLALTVGQKSTIKVTVSVKPNKAANKAVKYATSNKKVAKVSAKGVVTAVGKGSAKITITSKINSKKKATVKVSVAAGGVMPTVSPTNSPVASPTPTATVKPSPSVKPPNPNDLVIDLSKKGTGSLSYDATTKTLKNKDLFKSNYSALRIPLTAADYGADFDMTKYSGIEIYFTLYEGTGEADDPVVKMPNDMWLAGQAQVKLTKGTGDWDGENVILRKVNIQSEAYCVLDFVEDLNVEEGDYKGFSGTIDSSLKPGSILVQNTASTCTQIEISSIRFIAK